MNIALLLLLIFVSACVNETAHTAHEQTATADPRTYQVRGVLAGFLPDGRHIRIAHEAIPDFMAAMTMSFAVADTALLRGVQVGDSIRFTLTITGDDIEITSLQGIGQP